MEKTLGILLVSNTSLILCVFGAALVVFGIYVAANKKAVEELNYANAEIIKTKTFDEFYNVISSREVILQSRKLSDVIFRHFEKVVRNELEYYKSIEDYTQILKLFYRICTSYNWNKNFDTALYREFCSYLEIYTSKILDENQNIEVLRKNIEILNGVSLELECFFQEKRKSSPTDVATKKLRNVYLSYKRKFELESLTT